MISRRSVSHPRGGGYIVAPGKVLGWKISRLPPHAKRVDVHPIVNQCRTPTPRTYIHMYPFAASPGLINMPSKVHDGGYQQPATNFVRKINTSTNVVDDDEKNTRCCVAWPHESAADTCPLTF
jgi:hypothetical protein